MGFLSHLAAKSGRIVGKPVDAGSGLPILAPISGTVLGLEQTKDPAFSTGAMGDGAAILPAAGSSSSVPVLAPVSGTLMAVFPTGHAFAIAADDGVSQVIVHIGVETVSMKGDGFLLRAQQGDRVAAGQAIVDVDFSKIAAAGLDPTCFVVLCERAQGSALRMAEGRTTEAGQALLWLQS